MKDKYGYSAEINGYLAGKNGYSVEKSCYFLSFYMTSTRKSNKTTIFKKYELFSEKMSINIVFMVSKYTIQALADFSFVRNVFLNRVFV